MQSHLFLHGVKRSHVSKFIVFLFLRISHRIECRNANISQEKKKQTHKTPQNQTATTETHKSYWTKQRSDSIILSQIIPMIIVSAKLTPSGISKWNTFRASLKSAWNRKPFPFLSTCRKYFPKPVITRTPLLLSVSLSIPEDLEK